MSNLQREHSNNPTTPSDPPEGQSGGTTPNLQDPDFPDESMPVDPPESQGGGTY